jgi:plasmid stabilization system protein ParE
MRIFLSERVEGQLDRHFAYGIGRFGRAVADRTFARVRHFLFGVLAIHPRIGMYRAERDIHEVIIPRTPFVVFYRIDEAADMLTVVALFHHAQDRESEWGEL